ncbi:fungal-specific transcription factor domain-containing protein, partial [Plectosphaerella plurivora]
RISSYYEAEGIEQRRTTPSHLHQQPNQHAMVLPQTTIPELRPHNNSVTLGSTSTTITRAMAPLATTEGPPTGRPVTEAIVGHMGRLVNNDQGVAMFAGSTTGVHFVSQAEQQVQMLRIDAGKFPSSIYSLHLHDLWGFTSQRPSHHEVVRAIVTGLPLNAEHVLTAAINRWTPIYPVVHANTTLDAFRELMDIDNPLNDKSVAVLHQILGLLALGSIGHGGLCEKQHFHFLCLSETHYAASTTILDKVLEQPCLQALQALEIMQVYLQVSSRYTMASHFGGIATRLAQSLGLHRHSQRFRFDPLETELRRRVWWCQYSLDTFSSTYHGLPRLIRDQDVDTDLPTSVDHELLSRSHVAFPLPGEGSQVDAALHLFKISQIIGDALENLYTTTKRRGGVAKITRLQAELDMWARSLPGAATNTKTEPQFLQPEASFEAMFLKVVLCVATIQIHRPALSFTSPDPQSTKSLHACTRASAELIGLLASGLAVHDAAATSQPVPEGILLSLLYPSGAHMLWQSGLTMLYFHWKQRLAGCPNNNDDTALSDVELDATVKRCVRALRRLGDLTCDEQNFSTHRLGQCADVLDMLREKTFPRASDAGQGADPGAQLPDGWDQVSWNVWDWPMESVLD